MTTPQKPPEYDPTKDPGFHIPSDKETREIADRGQKAHDELRRQLLERDKQAKAGKSNKDR